jgi:NAD(P)H-dependent FMN reductase
MPHISIISSSVRNERGSHRVALYFQAYLKEHKLATSEILDLKAYNFPIFQDTFKVMKNPVKSVVEFAEKIKTSDGIIIVSPEYNGGYPASLKNVIDLLYEEWKRKPIAISTVSAGVFGGSQALVSIQFSLWKIGAWTITMQFPVPSVQKAFSESGQPTDQVATEKQAKLFVGELMRSIEANQHYPTGV